MNPEQLAEWALCFGLQAEQTDYEATGMHVDQYGEEIE